MSLRYKLNKGRNLLAALSPEEHANLTRICEDIRRSQEMLLENAGPAMQQCLNNCEGLCCRNARVDDIIGLWDLVYILTLAPDLAADMAARAEREPPFYSANCMFLKADTGPCIFAATIRPEVCVTTFCSGDETIQREIRRVKRQFFKIGLFFFWRRPRALLKRLAWRTRSDRAPTAPPLREAGHTRHLKIDDPARGEKNG
ncbi:MAG: hypothetical protein QNI88_17230 [Desulfobacterales bacterium]|nr:hypothetical protein [Desulfobacterales bacterium]